MVATYTVTRYFSARDTDTRPRFQISFSESGSRSGPS